MGEIEQCGNRDTQPVTEQHERASDGASASGGLEPSSTSMSGRIPRWAFHPILLGTFPILALFAQNASQVRLSDPIRVVAGALLGTAAIWFLAWGALKNARKAALFASAAIVLFFSFDFVVRWTEQLISTMSRYWVKQSVVVRPLVVLLPELFLLAFLFFLLRRRVRDLPCRDGIPQCFLGRARVDADLPDRLDQEPHRNAPGPGARAVCTTGPTGRKGAS